MNKPEENVQDILEDCISNINNKNLKRRFKLSKNYIKESTINYDQKACNHTIYTIKEHHHVNGILSKDNMVWLYKNKFSKEGQPGRKYYDGILHSAPGGRCPVCGVQIASTLDHYLAKTRYPSFAISPINLIPTCRDCNTVKKEKSFHTREEELLHPYYDNIEHHIWLFANIHKQKDIVVTYEVEKPIEWDVLLYKRVRNYFENYQLNRLYSVHAAEEITNIRKKLENLKNSVGLEAVKKDLLETAYSCEHIFLNSWRSALYRELSTNDWFCIEYLD